MQDEKLRVLSMLKEGTITAEEAMRLLDALEVPEEESITPGTKVKWFKIRVTDTQTNKVKVSVNLPIGLVDWALRAGTKVSRLAGVDLDEMGVDLEGLRGAINFGIRGTIVDVIDEDEHTHVEIVVE